MFGLFRKKKLAVIGKFEKGKRGRWRWYAVQDGVKICGSLPVYGFDTLHDAYDHYKKFAQGMK